MEFWKWFPSGCSQISLWKRDLWKTFTPSWVFKLRSTFQTWNCIENKTVTISGQNNRSFSGHHESLDGCEETNIILKYDVDLLEQKEKEWKWVSWVQMRDVHRFSYLFKQDERRGRLSAPRRRLITVLQCDGCRFLAVGFSRLGNVRNVKVICFLLHLEVASQSDGRWFSFGSSATTRARVTSCLSFQGRGGTSRKLQFSC